MIFGALALTIAAGWLLAPARTSAGVFPRACFAFGSGAAALSFQMFVYSLAGLPWNPLLLLAPWVAGAGVVLVRFRNKIPAPKWRTPAWWETLLLLAAFAPIAVWGPLERLMPLTSQAWDAWAIWLFKARAFYLDGSIEPFLTRTSEFSTQPGYPLLVPLYATFLYVVNGAVADQAAKILSPCYFVATLGVFHHFSRRFGRPEAAAATTLMLGWLPMLAVVAFRLAGYADTALAFYFLVAAGFLYGWLKEDRMEDLAGAVLGATAAAWSKNEGLLFLVAVGIVVAAKLIRDRGPWQHWLISAAPPLIVVGLWAAVRRTYGIDAADVTRATAGTGFSFDLLVTATSEMVAKAAQLDQFNLAFALLLVAIVAARPLRVSAAFWVLPGLVMWQFAGAVLVYSTGRNDLQWWLETSGDRILSQIAPMALLAFGIVYSAWLDRSEARAEPASGDRRAAEESRASEPARRRSRRRR